MAQIAAQEKFLEAIKVTMATVLRAWVSPWVEALRLKGVQRMQVLDLIWWTWSGSNRRPLPCHGSALPTAPQAHVFDFNQLGRVKSTLRTNRSKFTKLQPAAN